MWPRAPGRSGPKKASDVPSAPHCRLWCCAACRCPEALHGAEGLVFGICPLSSVPCLIPLLPVPSTSSANSSWMTSRPAASAVRRRRVSRPSPMA
ncbi:MAG: hypothetical protein C0503_05460, partial [Gemmatimonas sp.]|nr:hypothetical protein [Gemmatimonas sp.]